MYICIYTCVCIYIYIEREREREILRGAHQQRLGDKRAPREVTSEYVPRVSCLGSLSYIIFIIISFNTV